MYLAPWLFLFHGCHSGWIIKQYPHVSLWEWQPCLPCQPRKPVFRVLCLLSLTPRLLMFGQEFVSSLSLVHCWNMPWWTILPGNWHQVSTEVSWCWYVKNLVKVEIHTYLLANEILLLIEVLIKPNIGPFMIRSNHYSYPNVNPGYSILK